MKALDILRDHIKETEAAATRFESYATQTILKDKSILAQAEQTAKKYRGEVDVLERIAKAVEAAQAREKASQELCAILMRPTRYGPAYEQEREAQKRAMGEATSVLRDALAALDAEEGQAAAPQEEGEQQP